MESTTLFDQRVYAQDTAPSDKRDGILWVDTSKEPPATKVYTVDTDTWEPTAPGNVTISDTAPTGINEGHIWVDTSLNPQEAKVYNADTDNWVGVATPEINDHTANSGAHHSRYSDGEARNASHTLQAEGALSYSGAGNLIIWTMKVDAANNEADYVLYDLSASTEIGTMWEQAVGGSGYGYPFAHVNTTLDINNEPEFKVFTDEA